MNTVPAEPYPFEFDPATTALVIIDMQRDFVEPGGFGETLGNDVSCHLQAVVPPLRKVLETARAVGLTVITRGRARARPVRLPARQSSTAASRACASVRRAPRVAS